MVMEFMPFGHKMLKIVSALGERTALPQTPYSRQGLLAFANRSFALALSPSFSRSVSQSYIQIYASVGSLLLVLLLSPLWGLTSHLSVCYVRSIPGNYQILSGTAAQ